jgi:hypothetical protein
VAQRFTAAVYGFFNAGFSPRGAALDFSRKRFSDAFSQDY